MISSPSYCFHKTAVCTGDKLLDFSVLELIRSQSTFSACPEVLQNCAGFTLCSSAGLAVCECSAVMGLTSYMLCVQIYCVSCVLDYYLLNSELRINTFLLYPDAYGLNLCPLSIECSQGSGYHKLSTYMGYLNLQPKSSTFTTKLTQKYQKVQVNC